MRTIQEKLSETNYDKLIAHKDWLLTRTPETQPYAERGPRVTYAADGTLRMRAYVLDDDAYMGYLSNTHYLGVVFLNQELLVEAYYPYSENRYHEWLSFNYETGVATSHTEIKNTLAQDELPIPPTQVESDKNVVHLLTLLRPMGNTLVPSFEWQHEEDKRRQNWNGQEPFMFSIEQLQ